MNRSLHTLTQLLKKDLLSFMRSFPSKFFDTLCLFFTNVIVFGYFMQFEGAHDTYAAFFVVGVIASLGFVEIVSKVGVLIADIQGPRTIHHTLGLPIPAKWVFCSIALSWSMTSAILSAALFPIGKLLVFKGIDLSAISYPRLIVIFITVQLFFGFFPLWLTSMIENISGISSLWLRYIVPMWMFGGYTFSWYAAYQFNHSLGYVLLINPMIYVMEGMRAAVIGQGTYLPFWVCLLALWAFIGIFAVHSIRRLKKRLDCI